MMKIPVTSPESNVSRSYIDTLLNLPWNEMTEETFDLKQAAEILDEDHYGLEKVKERILEYLAVRKNAPEESQPSFVWWALLVSAKHPLPVLMRRH